jgi:preflagellin peptidase FlaK
MFAGVWRSRTNRSVEPSHDRHGSATRGATTILPAGGARSVTAADLLRLLAVPAFGWLALRDYRTRRVPGWAWYPILVLAVVTLGMDVVAAIGGTGPTPLFLVRVGFSLLVAALAYAFYLIGAFGGADAKAVAVLAVLFPVYPAYEVAGTAFPVVASSAGVFSLTVLTNGVVAGVAYPLAVGIRNAFRGHRSLAMLVALPVRSSRLLSTHGKLIETNSGATLSGLDLDALRMYLRWRGLALSDLRETPGPFRDPATLPDDPNPPTDGAVVPEADPEAGETPPAVANGDGAADSQNADPWGAAAFLEAIDGSAYGTDPETLRTGLDHIAQNDTVWVSPGLPFLVPLFVGLLIALSYGDVLFGFLGALGVV